MSTCYYELAAPWEKIEIIDKERYSCISIVSEDIQAGSLTFKTEYLKEVLLQFTGRRIATRIVDGEKGPRLHIHFDDFGVCRAPRSKQVVNEYGDLLDWKEVSEQFTDGGV